MKGDIGVIGLAVMGQNLILNMNDHGYKVIAYNRTASKIKDFMDDEAKNTNIECSSSLSDFVDKLASPRKIMLMVRAGIHVDELIEQLIPLLDRGDIIIDGGNSNYEDTNRRVVQLTKRGILYVGAGISGGEDGARKGPSIMPGGNVEAWPVLKAILQSIAAKTPEGEPCCDWVGSAGSGHFVKMVHNGIEYGDMQLISEVYHFMKAGLGLTYDEMQHIFADWNTSELDSYLIEITADILGFKDIDGQPLVEKILDSAGQKGTGKWTGINALQYGVPLTLITEAVFSRCISALKQQRVEAEKSFNKSITAITDDKQEWISCLKEALLASKIISYAQGFMLMHQASDEYHWDLNYGSIALMWRGGCIIRSNFLNKIKQAYVENSKIQFLGEDPYFKKIIQSSLPHWRKVVAKAIFIGLPMPAMTSALTFFDGYTSAQLPANLIQAQRDYFGAHTYKRIDSEAGQHFHTNWTGKGGTTSSSTYDV